MPTTRTPKTERLEELHRRLTAQVEALVSGEDWKAMLDVAARLHRYSARNVMLILSQRPEGVTRVAGYRRWQSLGRQVRKGEQGIAILAPCVYRARPADEAAGKDSAEVARILRGFRVAYVWDPLSRELSRVLALGLRLSMRVHRAELGRFSRGAGDRRGSGMSCRLGSMRPFRT